MVSFLAQHNVHLFVREEKLIENKRTISANVVTHLPRGLKLSYNNHERPKSQVFKEIELGQI